MDSSSLTSSSSGSELSVASETVPSDDTADDREPDPLDAADDFDFRLSGGGSDSELLSGVPVSKNPTLLLLRSSSEIEYDISEPAELSSEPLTGVAGASEPSETVDSATGRPLE